MARKDRQSQTLKAILGLRDMLLKGILKPGERVSELQLAQRLGISRTPAAKALAQLREEGLLEATPSGGYIVAKFSEFDVFDAVELRGTLEGLAARIAAERGVPSPIIGQMQKCADQLDTVVAAIEPGSDLSEFIRLNDQFHELLMQCTQSTVIKRSLERVRSLPFAAPNAFVEPLARQNPQIQFRLMIANEQHHAIIEAIQNREGARAAALTLEHSRAALRELRSTPLEALTSYCRP